MTSATTDAPRPVVDAPHVGSLTSVRPVASRQRLLADLVPPRHFAGARFETYRANPSFPSQAATVARLEDVARQITAPARPRGLFAARRRATAPAVYLDGGFGVGKTHLLAALAHAVGVEHTAYGTFVEYTNLVGALGFLPTVEALAAKRLVCVDEFELDDAGDTTLMSRLLRELTDRGVALAATSNTLPGALGEGRFAAEDFLREIQALAARFEVLRVDGDDYRHRAVVTDAEPLPAEVAESFAAARPDATLDQFDDLLDHLATVHPSRYGALLDGVGVVALTGVRPVARQDVALRLVVLVDRLYDRDVPVLLSGHGAVDTRGLFTEEMLRGGYRKKYYRALSRLGALAEDGRALATSGG
ncbi:cell division protein ZapE [Xylanimonas ulmi]|uniref:Cell division protein ZapE n=1 Tax=Xylanimonas ulmi TaxID=228973 RepID=A0A4Q7M279_9MICO|nr:cell division protein ZapE [Xylanibacterium ulmi]RZS61063.1 cell division protein ZapE [Xylanibacterium ulmi]